MSKENYDLTLYNDISYCAAGQVQSVMNLYGVFLQRSLQLFIILILAPLIIDLSLSICIAVASLVLSIAEPMVAMVIFLLLITVAETSITKISNHREMYLCIYNYCEQIKIFCFSFFLGRIISMSCHRMLSSWMYSSSLIFHTRRQPGLCVFIFSSNQVSSVGSNNLPSITCVL